MMSTLSIANSPVVKVPVLSKAKQSIFGIVSITWADFIIMPSRFNRVVAQVKAVGVAKDKAQGQVATNTDKVIQKASSGKCCCQ